MPASNRLRDFTLDRRVLMLSAMSLIIGAGGAGLAVGLSRLIGMMTNLFYFHRIGFGLVSPANTPVGPIRVLIL
jgi:hypothetical protein